MRIKSRGWLVTFIWLTASLAAAQEAARLGAEDAVGVRLSTEVIVGQAVVNELGHDRATVRELLIDPETGCIDLVVVSLDPRDTSSVAIPWHLLVMEPNGTLRLAATEDDLVPFPEEVSPQLELDDDPRSPSLPVDSSAQQAFVPKEDFFPYYDRDTVRRFQGVVVGSVVAPLDGGMDVLVLLVDLGNETMRMHVAPEWFLARQDVEIEPGELISFVGSEVSMDGEPVVLVSELMTGGRRVALRDGAGTPLW